MNPVVPLSRLLAFALLVLTMNAPQLAYASSHKAKPASTASQSAKKASAAKSTASKGKTRPSTKATASKSTGTPKAKTCHATVTHKGKKKRVARPCAEPAEPVLSNSPLHEKALQESGTPLEGSPVKARSAPIRAYAVDGSTFYHNGRLYRIDGLGTGSSAGLTNEHAAQKLQQILDSGKITLEPSGSDDTGAMRALVRIDGRDVVERLKLTP